MSGGSVVPVKSITYDFAARPEAEEASCADTPFDTLAAVVLVPPAVTGAS